MEAFFMKEDQDTEFFLSEKLKSIDEKIFNVPLLSIENLESKLNCKRTFFISKRKLAFSLLLAICFTSLFVFAYSRYLYDSKSLTIDKGLKNSEEQKAINYTFSSYTNNNITLSIQGVISDTIRTVLYVELLGVDSQNNSLSVDSLVDISGKDYKLDSVKEGENNDNLKGTTRKKLQFIGGPESDTNLKLKVSRIGSSSGSWLLDIPVKVYHPKQYTINKDFMIDGNIIKIEKVICSMSTLQIQFKEIGSFLFIKGGKVSNGVSEGEFLNGNAVPDHSDSSITNCTMDFEPIDITKADYLKLSMQLDLDQKIYKDIVIPIGN